MLPVTSTYNTHYGYYRTPFGYYHATQQTTACLLWIIRERFRSIGGCPQSRWRRQSESFILWSRISMPVELGWKETVMQFIQSLRSD